MIHIRRVFASGGGEGCRQTAKKHKRTFGGDTMSHILIWLMGTWVHIFIKNSDYILEVCTFYCMKIVPKSKKISKKDLNSGY